MLIWGFSHSPCEHLHQAGWQTGEEVRTAWCWADLRACSLVPAFDRHPACEISPEITCISCVDFKCSSGCGAWGRRGPGYTRESPGL